MNFIKNLRALFRMRKEYEREMQACQGLPIKFHNFCHNGVEGERPEDHWFYRFMKHRGLVDGSRRPEVAFFSVSGARRKIRKSSSDVKVFHTGENVRREKLSQYRDHCVNEVDLSMGFEDRTEPNYFRFPLWIFYIIEPEADVAWIRKRVETISSAGERIAKEKVKFCALIASHDKNGIRSKMFHAFSGIEAVDSAGILLNNTSELQKNFGNDKIAFLRRYKFNICPENSDAPGYVTEKLFQAIEAGCIPIYWGSANNPEPEVLNRDALLLWDDSDRGSSCLGIARDLHNDPGALLQFLSQPRFVRGAADYIIDRLDQLEEKLGALLNRSANVR